MLEKTYQVSFTKSPVWKEIIHLVFLPSKSVFFIICICMCTYVTAQRQLDAHR